MFSAEARAPKLADQPQRFVVFGDCGAGTAEEKAIAYRAYLSRPDFLMITGDIVYGDGRIAEYRDKVLADLERRPVPLPPKAPRCCGRPSAWRLRATTISPIVTLTRCRTGSRISIIGSSR